MNPPSISSLTSDDWTFVTTKRAVSIFSRATTPADGGLNEVKSLTTVNAGVQDILQHLTNPHRRRSKKDNVFENELISTQNGFDLVYRAQKMPWPLKVRDFLLRSTILPAPNGGKVWKVWSVVHPDYPPTPARVRANCQCMSWLLDPVTPWKTNVTYLLQVDLQGSLPMKIKNKIMTQDAMSAADLARFFSKRMQGGEEDAGVQVPKPGSRSREEMVGNKERGTRGSLTSSFGLWNGLRRGSKDASKGTAKHDDDEQVTDSGRSRGGSNEQYQWKPMSKNSREYFKEIVDTDGPEGAPPNRPLKLMERGGSQKVDNSSHGDTSAGGTKKDPPKWKQLRRNSREYFEKVLGKGKAEQAGIFDEADYERTPPPSPMDTADLDTAFLPSLGKEEGGGREAARGRISSNGTLKGIKVGLISPQSSREYNRKGSRGEGSRSPGQRAWESSFGYEKSFFGPMSGASDGHGSREYGYEKRGPMSGQSDGSGVHSYEKGGPTSGMSSSSREYGYEKGDGPMSGASDDSQFQARSPPGLGRGKRLGRGPRTGVKLAPMKAVNGGSGNSGSGGSGTNSRRNSGCSVHYENEAKEQDEAKEQEREPGRWRGEEKE